MVFDAALSVEHFYGAASGVLSWHRRP